MPHGSDGSLDGSMYGWLGAKAPSQFSFMGRSSNADITSSANCGSADRSFDHPVCALQDGLRNYDTYISGCLEVRDKLELGRLRDRQVAGLRASQNPVDMARGPAENVACIGRIRHQASRFRTIRRAAHHRQPKLYGEFREPSPMKERRTIWQNQDRLGPLPCHRLESIPEVIGTARFQRPELKPHPLRFWSALTVAECHKRHLDVGWRCKRSLDE